MADRYELKNGKFGSFFHDASGSGWDLPLNIVLDKLNEIDALKARLAKANEKRTVNFY